MTEELKTIDTVDTSPFKKLVMTIGELPTSFVESMTYYELLAWLCNYLQNTVIPAVNNNAEVSAELQAKFIELKSYVDNYFDNLDVQEEINNKLDAMAEDGTLQEIIGDYLNATAVWGFDTVADMAASTNLIAGSYARTLGHTTINDHKGGLYKIVDVVDTDYTQEDLGNGLYANLILDLPDFMFDREVVVLTGLISEQTYTNKYVYLDECSIYKTNFINCVVTGKCTTHGNWNVILDDNSTAFNLTMTNHNPEGVIYGLVLRGTNVKAINCKFTNRFYEAIVASGRNMVIERCKFASARGEGLYYVINIKNTKIRSSLNDGVYAVAIPENLTIKDCVFNNYADDNIEFFTGARGIRVINCYFNNDNTTAYISAKSFSYEREEGYNTEDDYTQNVLIENCNFIRETSGNPLYFLKYITDASDNFGVKDVTFNKCFFKNITIQLGAVDNFTFSNNVIENDDTTYFINYANHTGVIAESNRLSFINNTLSGRGIYHYGLYSLYLENNMFKCKKQCVCQASLDNVFTKTKTISNGNTYYSSDLTDAVSNAFIQTYGVIISNNDIMHTRSFATCIGKTNFYINNLLVTGGSRIFNCNNVDTNGTVNYHLDGVTITETINATVDSTLTFTHDTLI